MGGELLQLARSTMDDRVLRKNKERESWRCWDMYIDVYVVSIGDGHDAMCCYDSSEREREREGTASQFWSKASRAALLLGQPDFAPSAVT